MNVFELARLPLHDLQGLYALMCEAQERPVFFAGYAAGMSSEALVSAVCDMHRAPRFPWWVAR